MRKRIGDLLLEKGLINESQVQQVLNHSKSSGLRFGEAAMDLGLISLEQVIELFGPNYAVDFFHLDPEYFPENTKNLLTPEQMVRLGVVPLGFKTEGGLFRKRRVLNIGMVNPANSNALMEVENLARARLAKGEIQGTRPYLVLADQFIELLKTVYKMDVDQLRAQPPHSKDETLALFLEN